MSDLKVSRKLRAAVKSWASDHGTGYSISKFGDVMVYGPAPGSSKVGWWRAARIEDFNEGEAAPPPPTSEALPYPILTLQGGAPEQPLTITPEALKDDDPAPPRRRFRPAVALLASCARVQWGRILLSATLGGLAGCLAYKGLSVNAWFAETLAAPDAKATAGALWAWVATLIGAAGFTLPLVAGILSRIGTEEASGAAWKCRAAWWVCLTFGVCASIGFAAENAGTLTATKEAQGDARAALKSDFDQARTDRAAITIQASAAEQKAAITAALALVQASVRTSSKDCTIPAGAQATQSCPPVYELRRALATIERRDALDKRIIELSAKLAEAPVVGAADPMATMTVQMIEVLTWGWLKLRAEAVQTFRLLVLIMGVEILPSVLINAAVILWPRRETSQAA